MGLKSFIVVGVLTLGIRAMEVELIAGWRVPELKKALIALQKSLLTIGHVARKNSTVNPSGPGQINFLSKNSLEIY